MTNNIYEEEWYTFLKKKYKLSDEDFEEYIESFKIINNGNPITVSLLQQLVWNELRENWSNNECLRIIQQINLKVNGKVDSIINLRTFLFYIIPICQDYIVKRINVHDLFDSLDKDRDGKISCDELMNIVYMVNKKYTHSEIEIYKKKVNEICEIIDTDKDNCIGFDEFINFLYRMNII
jgi:Ca2+-binding EF-hand superfamily protein